MNYINHTFSELIAMQKEAINNEDFDKANAIERYFDESAESFKKVKSYTNPKF